MRSRQLSTNPTTSISPLRRIARATAPFVVGALVTLVAFMLLRNTLPDRFATHFGLDGKADGYSSPATALGQYMLVFAVEAAGIAAAGLSIQPALRTVRVLTVFAWGLAGATTYLFIAVMGSLGGADSAQFPLYHLALAAVVGVAVAAAAWAGSRRQS